MPSHIRNSFHVRTRTFERYEQVSGTKDWKTRDEALTLMVRIEDRLIKLPEATMLGLLKGFSAALAVAERHAEDKGEKWLTRDVEHFLRHAATHIEIARVPGFNAADDDGLPHPDHAACDILLAIAKREGM